MYLPSTNVKKFLKCCFFINIILSLAMNFSNSDSISQRNRNIQKVHYRHFRLSEKTAILNS